MFTGGQIADIVIFMSGIGILTWLSKVERKQLAKMRDPREKWAYIDGGADQEKELRQRSRRSTVLTGLGIALALFAFYDFLIQV